MRFVLRLSGDDPDSALRLARRWAAVESVHMFTIGTELYMHGLHWAEQLTQFDRPLVLDIHAIHSPDEPMSWPRLLAPGPIGQRLFQFLTIGGEHDSLARWLAMRRVQPESIPLDSIIAAAPPEGPRTLSVTMAWARIVRALGLTQVKCLASEAEAIHAEYPQLGIWLDDAWEGVTQGILSHGAECG